MIDIGDGIEVPETVPVVQMMAGYDVTGTATFDPQSGRYVLMRLAVDSRGPEVTGELLRTVKPATYVRTAAEAALAHYFQALDTETPTGPTAETLRRVALIYRLAVLVGDAPTALVAERLGVPKSTAGRWVTRARDRGLLTVMDKRARTEA